MTERDYERHVVDALSAGVREWLSAIEEAGRGPETLGAPEDLADRMLATLPAPHPWDKQIGPFYDTPRLVKLLGVSKQAIADRVRRRTLLAATTKNGRVVYPTFQFDGHRVRGPVAEVLSVFKGTPVDGWAVGAWFTTPSTALGGATPVEWLYEGGDVHLVWTLARDANHRWAA